MMRRVDLLPERYFEQERQRRNIGLVLATGLFLLLLLIVWWARLGFQVSDARQDLAQVEAENLRLETEIAELQHFQDLANEVAAKKGALAAVMAGDIDWPVLLTEVAMAVPGEVWLTSLTASAGTTEGSAPVGTETASIQLSSQDAFGRITFEGNALSIPGVAKWLIRQGIVKRFEAVWLNDASKTGGEEGTQEMVQFGSTIELNEGAGSNRFVGDAP